jgi:hypothetical protein
MMMRDLFILNATLRKNIKNSVVLFLLSTPLMAAETITLKNSDSLLSSGSTDTCYKNLCIEVREDKKCRICSRSQIGLTSESEPTRVRPMILIVPIKT